MEGWLHQTRLMLWFSACFCRGSRSDVSGGPTRNYRLVALATCYSSSAARRGSPLCIIQRTTYMNRHRQSQCGREQRKGRHLNRQAASMLYYNARLDINKEPAVNTLDRADDAPAESSRKLHHSSVPIPQRPHAIRCHARQEIHALLHRRRLALHSNMDSHHVCAVPPRRRLHRHVHARVQEEVVMEVSLDDADCLSGGRRA